MASSAKRARLAGSGGEITPPPSPPVDSEEAPAVEDDLDPHSAYQQTLRLKLSVTEPAVFEGKYVELGNKFRKGLETEWNRGAILDLKVPVIHFNYFCKGQYGTLLPAEYAISSCSLGRGIEFTKGGLIDPGEFVTSSELSERCENFLHIPRPGFSYKAGLGYGAGEDIYANVVDTILDNAFLATIRGNKVVFTLTEHLETVTKCLRWLSFQIDRFERLEISVMPLELFVRELVQVCEVGRLCESRGMKTIPEVYDDQMKAVRGTTDLPSCLSELDNSFWNTRLRLGCEWHQQQTQCDGLKNCSTLHAKKWNYVLVNKGRKRLGLDPIPYIKDMTGADKFPTVWHMDDAIGIEARHRLGQAGPISAVRRVVLEEGFVFPNLLERMKVYFPNGFTKQPREIIWPVDRSIEEDLNYAPHRSYSVKDPDPEGRAKKLREKLARDAAKRPSDDW